MPFYYHRFEHQVFENLVANDGTPDWCFALLAAPLTYFPALVDFLRSLTLINSACRCLCNIGMQKLLIVDPPSEFTHRVPGDRPRIASFPLFTIHS
jgi:hypothetical protein